MSAAPDDHARLTRARLTRAGAACALVHARHLLAQPNGWYQPRPQEEVPRGFFACMADGTDCWATDRFATSFCPQGAVWRAAWLLGLAPAQEVLAPDPPVVLTALAWLARAVDARADRAAHPAVILSTWSDSRTLSKPQVLAAFDRACALAQATITELDYPQLATPAPAGAEQGEAA